MKVVWFSFLLAWVFILLYEQSLSWVLWWLLLFLWLGLLMHYTIAYRHWSKEMNIRREERRKFILEGKSGGTEVGDRETS